MGRLRSICPVDGPRAFQPREVRVGGSTMDDVLVENAWNLYDRAQGAPHQMQVVRWQETGTFIAGATPGSIMHAVTEVSRSDYTGIL